MDLSPDTDNTRIRPPHHKMYPYDEKYSEQIKPEALKFVEYRVKFDNINRSKEILNFLKKKHFNTPKHLKNGHILISKKENKLGTDIRLDLLKVEPKIKNGYI